MDTFSGTGDRVLRGIGDVGDGLTIAGGSGAALARAAQAARASGAGVGIAQGAGSARGIRSVADEGAAAVRLDRCGAHPFQGMRTDPPSADVRLGSGGGSPAATGSTGLTAACPPTRSGGRLGNEATRRHVREVADELETRGYRITFGGGRYKEEYLRPLGGGRKGGSYVDITAEKGGHILRINTIDTLVDGVTPTSREWNNAIRIRRQKPGEHLLLIPKPK